MNLSNRSTTTLPPTLAATLIVAAAAMAAALAPPIWHARQDAQAPPLLTCELAPAAAPTGMKLVITNRSNLPLPAGSALSWASLGTPTPAGGMQMLAQELAPGDSVALATVAVLHASGCLVSLAPSR